MAGCAKKKPIAGLADGGITQPIPGTWIEQRDRQNAINPPAPFQETWVEKRDRENAINPPAPFQETWVEQRDRETAALAPKLAAASATSRRAAAPVTSMGLPTFQGLGVKRTPMAGIAGLAEGGIAGVIPGKVNPKVADDVVIRAKKGEYVIPQEVVAFLGKDRLDQLVLEAKKKLGLPAEIGPKRHDEPDSQGRMDKPGLRRGIAGSADGGLQWYETDPNKIKPAGESTTPADYISAAAGWVGNKINNASLTDKGKEEASRVLAGSTPESKPVSTLPQPGTYDSVPGSFEMIQGLKENVKPAMLPISSLEPIAKAKGITPGTVPVKSEPTTSAPTATPKLTPPVAGAGSGFSSVGGKRIDYQDIGTNRDPMYSRRTDGIATVPDGQAMMLGNVKGYRPSRDLDWSPGSANVRNLEANAKYNDEVKRAGIANAILQGPKTADQHLLAVQSGNTTWSMNPQQQQAIAGTNFAAQEKGIADTKDVESRRYVADAGLEGHKYAADSALKGQGIASAAHVEAARIAEQGQEAKAKAAHGLDQAKDSKEMIKTYYDSIKHLDLPAGYEGRHMELAKDLANAQDPATDFGIYHAPGSQRQGIATKKSVYEPLLAKYTKAGYPLADAHASAYRDLLALERQNGVQLHKPFPNLDILRSRNMKPVDPILGAS